MGKPLPMELRRRVVDFVEEGRTHRAAAAQFRVSIKFVNDMVLLKRPTAHVKFLHDSGGVPGCLSISEIALDLQPCQKFRRAKVNGSGFSGIFIAHRVAPVLMFVSPAHFEILSLWG